MRTRKCREFSLWRNGQIRIVQCSAVENDRESRRSSLQAWSYQAAPNMSVGHGHGTTMLPHVSQPAKLQPQGSAQELSAGSSWHANDSAGSSADIPSHLTKRRGSLQPQASLTALPTRRSSSPCASRPRSHSTSLAKPQAQTHHERHDSPVVHSKSAADIQVLPKSSGTLYYADVIRRRQIQLSAECDGRTPATAALATSVSTRIPPPASPRPPADLTLHRSSLHPQASLTASTTLTTRRSTSPSTSRPRSHSTTDVTSLVKPQAQMHNKRHDSSTRYFADLVRRRQIQFAVDCDAARTPITAAPATSLNTRMPPHASPSDQEGDLQPEDDCHISAKGLGAGSSVHTKDSICSGTAIPMHLTQHRGSIQSQASSDMLPCTTRCQGCLTSSDTSTVSTPPASSKERCGSPGWCRPQ